MQDDEFTKLFKYMEKQFNLLHAELGQKADKQDLDKILRILDQIESHYDTEEQERAALAFADTHHEEQLENHEQRLGRLEDQTA